MADSDIQKKSDIPKRENMKIQMLHILLVVCIVAVVVSAGGLGHELYINSKSRAYYSELTADIQVRPRNKATNIPPSPAPAATMMPDTNYPAGENTIRNIGFEESQWTPYVDFESLREKLPGISAWIKLEGTTLNYPLMQGTDNYYFLSHLPDGTKHKSGSIFIDYRNNADFSDKNTLIYGHESKTGDMFAILKSYRKQEFYEANKVLYIYTPEHDYELLPIAGYLVDSGVESPPLKFKDDADFQEHITAIKRRSLFKSDVEVSPGERIVSLCTCAYDYPNARLVIVGKLVNY